MTQRGMVLFITMVMLAIMSTLIVSLMQTLFLSVKASTELVNRHQAFYQLEAAASHLQAFSFFKKKCVVHEINSNEVIEMLKRNHGCEWVDAKQDYVYLIEDLGIYPCLQIESKGLFVSSHHWLLSIATKDLPFELIQLRIAHATPIEDCEGHLMTIHDGIISWRHLLS